MSPLDQAIQAGDEKQILKLLNEGFNVLAYYKPEDDPSAPQDVRMPIEHVFNHLVNQPQLVGVRLDILYILFRYALDQKKQLPNYTSEKANIMQSIIDCAQLYLYFYLNVQSDNDVKKRMAIREKVRSKNIEYIPGMAISYHAHPAELAADTFQYRWLKIGDLLKGRVEHKEMHMHLSVRQMDERLGARQLTNLERDKYRVFLFGGNLYSAPAVLLNTTQMVSHLKNDFAAFVINTNGEISFFNHYHDKSTAGFYVHSTMNALKPVFAAGEMRVHNGKIKAITDYSGHYGPELNNIFELLHYLVSHGMDISETQVQLGRGTLHLDGLNVSEVHGVWGHNALDIYETLRFYKQKEAEQLYIPKTAIQLALVLEKMNPEMRLSYFLRLNFSIIEKLVMYSDETGSQVIAQEELNLLKSKLGGMITYLNFIDHSFEDFTQNLHFDQFYPREMVVHYILHLMLKGRPERLISFLQNIKGKINHFEICVEQMDYNDLLRLMGLLNSSDVALLANKDNIFHIVKNLLQHGSDEILDILLQKIAADVKGNLYNDPLLLASSDHSVSPTQWLILFDNNVTQMSAYILGRSAKGTFGFIDAVQRLNDETRWGQVLAHANKQDFDYLFSDIKILEFAIKSIQSSKIWDLLIDIMTPHYFANQLQRIAFSSVALSVVDSPAGFIIYSTNPWLIDMNYLLNHGFWYDDLMFLQNIVRQPEQLDLSTFFEDYVRLYSLLDRFDFAPAHAQKWLTVLINLQSVLNKDKDKDHDNLLYQDLLQVMIVKIMVHLNYPVKEIFLSICKIIDFSNITADNNFYLSLFMKSVLKNVDDGEGNILPHICYFQTLQQAVIKGYEGAEEILESEVQGFSLSHEANHLSLNDRLIAIKMFLLGASLVINLNKLIKADKGFFSSQPVRDMKNIRAKYMEIKDFNLIKLSHLWLSIPLDKSRLSTEIKKRILDIKDLANKLLRPLQTLPPPTVLKSQSRS